MRIPNKLPHVGTTIFTTMSALANEHGAINLSQGFPNFASSPKLTDLVCHYLREGYNQYAPMPGILPLRQRIAEKILKLYGHEVDPHDEITITTGASEAIFTAILAFVEAGDEVIIIEPAFDIYAPAIELAGGRVVSYEMSAPDYHVDWAALQKLVTPRTRMIIVNTPHNPTGAVFSAGDLDQLDRLTRDTDILILSDEVYEHLVFDGREHQSALRKKELWSRCIATFSFGKTFHNTGWKVGYCVMPAPLMREFRKVHQYNVFTVHTPTQYALADFLEDPQEYLQLNDFFQAKRDHFLAAMQGSRLRPIPCEGTYFHLFDYRAVSDESDLEFTKRLTTAYGVAAIPVSAFYRSGRDEQVVRFCFAKTEETLERAGALLRKI